MKLRLEKTMQIADDLMLYCCSLGAKKYHTDFTVDEEACSFRLEVEVEGIDQEVLEELDEALKKKRSKEVEQLYWAINYDSDSTCELVMIGMMLDKASVAYDGKSLVITGTRKD